MKEIDGSATIKPVKTTGLPVSEGFNGKVVATLSLVPRWSL